MNVILHIGLDVHNESIAVSIAPSDSTEVRRWGILGGLKRRRRAEDCPALPHEGGKTSPRAFVPVGRMRQRRTTPRETLIEE